MANDVNNLPFEVSVEKTKSEIVQSINLIGKDYNIPPSILVMILSEIVNESKLNTYTSILSNCNIVPPIQNGSIPEDNTQ